MMTLDIRQLIHKVILTAILLFSTAPTWAIMDSDTTINRDVPYDSLHLLPAFDGVRIIEFKDHHGEIVMEKDSLGDNVPTIAPSIYCLDTTYYTVTYIDPNNYVNYITNGDFEMPLTDEEADELSDYRYISPGENDATTGCFGIGDNPRDLKPNENWCSIPEAHKDSVVSGKMFYADGGKDHVTVYKTQTDYLTKGTTYVISGYYASLNDKYPYRLKYVINDSVLSAFRFPYSNKTWNHHYIMWTADKDGPATLEIVNNHYSNTGNDFAFDDLAVFPTKEYVIQFIPNNIPPNTPDYHFNVYGATMLQDNIGKDIWDANIEDTILLNTIPVVAPEHGTVSILPDGAFTYYPDSASIVTNDLFTYEVCETNNDMECSQGTVYITVDDTLLTDTIIQTILCGDSSSLMLECIMPTDTPFVYGFYYDDSAMYDIGLSNVMPDTIMATNQDSISTYIYIPIPDTTRQAHCKGMLTLEYEEHKTQVIAVEFDTKYPNTILQEKWGNVIAILNESHNGGHTFSAYQWLEDGIPIPGETSPILYLKDMVNSNAEYSVLLTDAEEGDTVETCPIKMTSQGVSTRSTSVPSIHISPSIISPEGLLKTQTSVSNGAIKVWDIQGVLQHQEEVHDHIQFIQAPLRKGFYMIGVINEDGSSDIKRFMVK